VKRCFVGLRIDERAQRRLAEAQATLEQLGKTAARRLRLVPPENFHATLKFLGATADQQVPELTSALAAVARRFEPVEVLIEGFGAFPSPARPRVLFAALGAGRDWAASLAADVDAAAVELSFAREERPHVPHVTLARVEQAKPHGRLSDWLTEALHEPLGRVLTSHLVLFESKLGSDHARYAALCELPLGG
jgi:2'-5' RNA ligase